MAQVKASITPALLKWARKELDISDKTAMKEMHKNYFLWEEGKDKPSIPQLREIAKKYKRPLAVFYLKTPPKTKSRSKDCRTINSQQNHPLTKPTILAMRRAGRVQDLAIELSEYLDEKLKFEFISVNLDTNTEELALMVRERLGVSLETQMAWKEPKNKRGKEAYLGWHKAIEQIGIIVLKHSFPEKEARGFALYSEEVPVIVVNSHDTDNGKIFSLFHELGHIMLRKSAMSDMKYVGYADTTRKIEIFCNRFAGEFLVPKYKLLKIAGENLKSHWNEDEINSISKKFSVSRFVIIRRLFDNKLMSQDFYKQKQDEYNKEFKEKSSTFFGKPNLAKRPIRNNGEYFTGLVLDNFHLGHITYKDVADYLNTKTKYVGEVITRFEGGDY